MYVMFFILFVKRKRYVYVNQILYEFYNEIQIYNSCFYTVYYLVYKMNIDLKFNSLY